MTHDRVQLERFPTTDALASALADRWLATLHQASSSRQSCRVALSGGRIAAIFQRQVAVRSPSASIDWNAVEFFWGDERCVPPDHPDSNFHSADQALLSPCNVPASQIHRLRGELPPPVGAEIAVEELRALCPLNDAGWPVLDLVMLGMGEDGHVASLFPDTPKAQTHGPDWVISVIGPKPPPQRLSFTFGVLAAAKSVWVLATGGEKGAALRASLDPSGQTPLAQLLQMRAATVVCVDDAIFRAANA